MMKPHQQNRGNAKPARIQCLIIAASLLTAGHAGAAIVDLGAASGFAVLGGSAITNTGATAIRGDIGTFSATAITGIGSIALIGVNHGGDAVTQAAHASLLSAYNTAAGLAATTTYTPIFDLGGLTLGPGVHKDSSSFGITGTLTLDGNGDPNAFWVFQMGSTLTTSSTSAILLTNGAKASNVFWQVGSSATLGIGSQFAGTIMALESITLTTGAAINGRALAYNGAVTMQGNTVAVPEAGSALLLLGAGLSVAFSGRARPRTVLQVR